ncbi:MAG: leucine-rich repeat protein [Bacteroidaceae bacterium]|nr:leucine-rich repeat protein [Bacteroidaceae bacterium]
MKRFLLFAVMTLSSMSIHAYDFEVDGIYYNITSASAMTVEVTYKEMQEWNGSDYYVCKYSGKVSIPATINYNRESYKVVGIGAHAFSTEVGNDWADRNKVALTSIEIPEGIEYIGPSAFRGCDGLTEVYLPSSITNIALFAFTACSKLTMVFVPCSIPPQTTYGGFGYNGQYGRCEIIVPQKKLYLSDSEWSQYGDRLVELLTIEDSIFTYDGMEHDLTWVNNIKSYELEVTGNKTSAKAGEGVANIIAKCLKGGKVLSEYSFNYNYYIQKALLNIVIGNASKIYGDENPNFSYSSITGFVNDEDISVINKMPELVTKATNKSKVGEYPITIYGGEAQNYEFAFEPGTLTIIKAPLSAKVVDTTKVYGSRNPSFTIDYIGLKNDETVPSWISAPSFQTEATERSGVGQYAIKAVNGTPVNYDLEIEDGTLSITPAPLTITAKNAERLYYSDEPNFSYTCNGFRNGDNESVLTTVPHLSTTATLTSNVGTYEIKAEDASSSNYSISYVNGTLTITPRTLMAYVDNYERVYNEENPVFEVKYDGFVGDDDEKVLTSKPEAKTTATKTSDVGTYPIQITGGNADNYTFSYTSGHLTIKQAEQTIVWEQELKELKEGDQIELTAKSTSGLTITYTSDDSSIAEVYTVGNKCYLDCKAEGEIWLMAVQNGNQNYYPSPRTRKKIGIGDASAIHSKAETIARVEKTANGIKVVDAKNGEIVRVYNTSGQLLRYVKIADHTVNIPLEADNIYIIKVGTKTAKIGY